MTSLFVPGRELVGKGVVKEKSGKRALFIMLSMLWLSFLGQNSRAFDNIHLLEDAAAGDHEAEYTLAHLYLKGKGGVGLDIDHAINLLRRAADGGHLDGMYDLAMVLLDVEDHASGRSEALDWLVKSAKRGHRDAQFALGRAYGLKFPEQGVFWLRKAVQNNHPEAQEYLREWCESDSVGCDPREK